MEQLFYNSFTQKTKKWIIFPYWKNECVQQCQMRLLFWKSLGKALGNSLGKSLGNSLGKSSGEVQGKVHAKVWRKVQGNVWGKVWGIVWGKVHGKVKGKVWGKVQGNVWGKVLGISQSRLDLDLDLWNIMHNLGLLHVPVRF